MSYLTYPNITIRMQVQDSLVNLLVYLSTEEKQKYFDECKKIVEKEDEELIKREAAVRIIWMKSGIVESLLCFDVGCELCIETICEGSDIIFMSLWNNWREFDEDYIRSIQSIQKDAYKEIRLLKERIWTWRLGYH